MQGPRRFEWSLLPARSLRFKIRQNRSFAFLQLKTGISISKDLVAIGGTVAAENRQGSSQRETPRQKGIPLSLSFLTAAGGWRPNRTTCCREQRECNSESRSRAKRGEARKPKYLRKGLRTILPSRACT